MIPRFRVLKGDNLLGLTKKNHYNPCFWTALWNIDYFNAFKNHCETKLLARNQKVFSLNIKADKIIPTTTENVHFEKHLGIAEITP